MIPSGAIAHAPSQPDPATLIAHALAGIGSALLLAFGVAAFTRRGSRSYLLVVLALVALAGRTLVSTATMFGPLSPELHHLAEHGLDAMLATFLLAAIYFARSTGAATEEIDR